MCGDYRYKIYNIPVTIAIAVTYFLPVLVVVAILGVGLDCSGAKGKIMSSEVLLSSVIPFAYSGLIGYAISFALKKILKWMLIIVAFLAGMFFVDVKKSLYQQ